jgi:outer membrane protein assembly factor BamE
MRILPIFIALIAGLGLSGCGSMSDVTDAIPNALDRAPLIYRPTIQQGNVVSQEQINALQPGMSKRQVRFVLGTPMLDDVFHADRWDYVFTLGEGSRPKEMQRVTLFFSDDRLARITGDLSPQPESEQTPPDREIVVSVPDWEEPNKSLFRRFIDLFDDED